MTVEEYIQFETTSEVRHEYINGQLVEMPGENKLNGKIAAFLSAYLMLLLEESGYIVYSHDIKVAIPNENKYYYPDLVVTNEPENLGNDYVV
ncbi:Uma2 family endonuclease, partial [Enterobacter kobei]|uniref:Uma2 family endonuclease n=1 Tax=Enterobacter kobei TaxID=208224 RepID=UPI0032AF6329